MELSYFLLLPFTIATAWIVAFLVGRRYVRLYDRVALLLLCCCALTCYIVVRSLSPDSVGYLYIILDNLESVLGLSICPLFYLYIRMVAHDSHWHPWYYLLFVAAVLMGVAGTALSLLVGWDRILSIRQDCFETFTPNPLSRLEQLYGFVNIALFNIILVVMAVVLIAWSIFYLIKYYRHVVNYYADIVDSKVEAMRNFLFSTILLLLTIFAITIFITDIVKMGTGIHIAISAWLSVLAWCICSSTYQIRLTDRNIDLIDAPDNNLPDETEMADAADVIGLKISQWQTDAQKPFCQMSITINDVAREMDVNPRQLSVYINKRYGVNFNRWINTLRIEEAKRMLSAPCDVKISYVALVCGFSDPAAFTKAFHKIEGCSPKEFKIKRT